MNKEKNSITLPFNNFFIISYILPGFLFVLTAALVSFVFRVELMEWALFRNEEFVKFVSNFHLKDFLNKDTAFSLELIVLGALLFLSIILGNAISVIGGLVFDNLWMGKGIGWPYERLLGFYPKKYTRRAFYLFIFLFLHVISILFIYHRINSLTWYLISLFVFFVFLREFIIKKVYFKIFGDDEYIVEKMETLVTKKSQIYETFFGYFKILRIKHPENKIKFWLIYLPTFAFLIDIAVALPMVLGKFFSLSLGFESSQRKIFFKKYKKAFKVDEIKNKATIYWNVYIYLVNNNIDNVKLANTHLRRSILLRNLAAVFLVLEILMFTLRPEESSILYLRWRFWAIICYVSGMLLFIGYNITFYKYYTKYLIRSFILFKKK